jgi:hypothetical protein
MPTRLFVSLSLLAVLVSPLFSPIGSSPAEITPFESPPATTHDIQTASSSSNVELVGHAGGAVDVVAVNGTYAYVSEGQSLTVLDISNPTAPKRSAKLSSYQAMC